ncbi:hypothetical protein [Rhodopirellula bahusiensis]|uniref:hypothetical protein n=1 Tax=Rhodopirellula bahusiensis TaxID=2014065 RepID=UPI0032638CA2
MSEEITWQEVRQCLELGSWTTIALAPFLYWINGPAVSVDQWVMRTGLTVIAVVVAISTTGRRLFAKTEQ